MDDDPETRLDQVDQLTEAQRRCLRLVLAHMTSKEIGRELQLSPHTIDAHLKAAMRTLGVSTRIQAARLLEEAEAWSEALPEEDSDHQSLVYQPSVMAIAAEMDEISDVSEGIGLSRDVDYTNLVETYGEHEINSVHDANASSGTLAEQGGNILDWFGKNRRHVQSRENRLSPSIRIMIIIFVCIISIFTLLSTVSALQLLSTLYE